MFLAKGLYPAPLVKIKLSPIFTELPRQILMNIESYILGLCPIITPPHSLNY